MTSVTNAAQCLQGASSLDMAVKELYSLGNKKLEPDDYKKFATNLIENGENLSIDNEDLVFQLAEKVSEGSAGNEGKTTAQKIYSTFAKAVIAQRPSLTNKHFENLVKLESKLAGVDPEMAHEMFDICFTLVAGDPTKRGTPVRSFAHEAGVFNKTAKSRIFHWAVFKAEKFLLNLFSKLFDTNKVVQNLSYSKQAQSQSRSLELMLALRKSNPSYAITQADLNQCLLIGSFEASEAEHLKTLGLVQNQGKEALKKRFNELTTAKTTGLIGDDRWMDEQWRQAVLDQFEEAKKDINEKIAAEKNKSK